MSERTLEELKRDLDEDFKLDDYLELRRRLPNDTCVFLGPIPQDDPYGGLLEYMIVLKELPKFNISIERFARALAGEVNLVDGLCVEILEAISKRKRIIEDNAHAVANGLAISESLLLFMVSKIFDILTSHETAIPASFRILLDCHLGMWANTYSKELGAISGRLSAQFHLARDPNLSLTDLAKIIGVNKSTVLRWQQTDGFWEDVEMFKSEVLSNTHGVFGSIDPLKRQG